MSRVVDLLATIRTDGGPVAAPDNLLLAILSAPSFGLIWPHLGTAEKKREFLKMIFTTHGLHVNAAGVVSVFGLLPGFEIFEIKQD